MPKPTPKKFVEVVPNEPKGWFQEFMSRLMPPEHDLGYISQEHLFDIHARSNRNWWFDKRGNRWPLHDTL